MRRVIAALIGLSFVVGLTACAVEDQPKETQYQRINKKANKRQVYEPKNDVEFKNYNEAQKVYDDATSILWCTFSFNNSSSPLVTVPVAGKLTSSSTTYFSPVTRDGYALPTRSVDGLFHPNPPPYRYGFTPAGAYVDFFNLETYCSTKPTKFQREKTEISLEADTSLSNADAAAQDALKAGQPGRAQKIIENAVRSTK